MADNFFRDFFPGSKGEHHGIRFEDAYIDRRSGILTVIPGADIYMSFQDEDRLRKNIYDAVPGVTGVRLEYRYTENGKDYPETPAKRRDTTVKKSRDSEGETLSYTSEVSPEKTDIQPRESAGKEDKSDGSGSESEGKEIGISVIEAGKDSAGLKSEGKEIGISVIETGKDSAGSKAGDKEIPEGRTEKSGSTARRAKETDKTGGRRSKKRKKRILGKPFEGDPVSLSDISENSGEVVVEGSVFRKETRITKNGNFMIMILLTDRKTTVCALVFLKEKTFAKVDPLLNEGDYLICHGEVRRGRFDNEINIIVRDIESGESSEREDICEDGKRVELHCHTKMSALDGLNDPKRIVDLAARWGQPAVAITDHGVVQAFPDAAEEAEKLAEKGTPVKVIYGMEGYLYDDADSAAGDEESDYKKGGTNHIILLCRTQEGLRNLYMLVSISHLKYFYKRPRIPRSLLDKYREGLITGSACEAGELYRAIENGEPEEKLEEIASYYDYLEIQPLVNNQFLIDTGKYDSKEQLRENNRKILALGEKLGKPVCATTDAHYDESGSYIYRNIVMNGMGFKNTENSGGLFLRTTDEMMEEFRYLGDDAARRVVIEYPNKVASWVDEGIVPVPKGKYPPRIEGAEERLRKTCLKKAHEIYGDPLPREIRERLDTELNAIISNGYAVMYVSAQMLVNKSLEDGYLVGSRGSVGSSFAATMAGITEVNPLEPHYICPSCRKLIWGDKNEYDNGIDMPPADCPDCGTPMKRDGFNIPFATFMGFKGNKEPDIDLNFAAEYQSRAQKYVGTIFGEKNVFKAGTVGTIKEKTAFGFVKHYEEDYGVNINKYEEERLVEGITGVRRTTGQHPGGIVVVPGDHEITEFTPVQHPADAKDAEFITTHFDYHKIDQNLLKLDVLGHNVPSMIRQLQDMTGVDPLKIDLTDKKVLSIFNGTEALDIKDPDYRFTHGSYAVPEFGTAFVRKMLDDVRPQRFEDLVRIAGLSHGTDVWLNNAQDYIRDGIASIREVISTRDDIMNFCLLHGIENETSFLIMEEVRKKNLTLTEEHKEEMLRRGIPQWYIDSCARIKYMFPRAHAVAYVMMSFRLAWFKVYYPAEFYATYFGSVLSDFDAETILKGQEECLLAIDEITAKGRKATDKDKNLLTVYEVAYEMYARGLSLTEARLGYSKALRFGVEDGKVILPYAAYPGMGPAAAQALETAYEERPFETVSDCRRRTGLGKGAVDVLTRHGLFTGIPEDDQFSLF